MKMNHIDCFSGVGGICTGMHAAGFDTLVAIEKVKSCVDTYTANHPDVHVIHSDIRQVTGEQILPFVPDEGVDLVTSGMPCETFSTAGNTSRSFYDDRQFLFREGIRIAKLVNAKMILFENVPAITTKTVAKGDKTLIVDVLKKELVEAGYSNFLEVVLDASQFGVPQRRKRYFILATRYQHLNLSAPIPTTQDATTVKDALIDIPEVTPNTFKENRKYLQEESEYSRLMKNGDFWRRNLVSQLSYHMPMKHRSCTLKRFAMLRPGESLKELFERYQGDERKKLQDEHVLPKKMFIKRNYRLKLDEPSPTVTSHCLDEFKHPVENRALTVRECARLQSFPDSYDFVGGPYLVPHIDREIQDKYEQIGDAVSPLLAKAWGLKILELLKEIDNGNGR
ncbi:MAG: DNA cytosine methyltransferase [Victivallales bacterium]|nr:DNA cytosine methyltransferase [Victivallales bacterium]